MKIHILVGGLRFGTELPGFLQLDQLDSRKDRSKPTIDGKHRVPAANRQTLPEGPREEGPVK